MLLIRYLKQWCAYRHCMTTSVKWRLLFLLAWQKHLNTGYESCCCFCQTCWHGGEGRVRWEGVKQASRVDLCCSTLNCQRWESCAKVILSTSKQTKRAESSISKTWLLRVKKKMFCYIIFFHSADINRYWVSGADSADGTSHPSRHWSQFVCIFRIIQQFIWKDRQKPPVIHRRLQKKTEFRVHPQDMFHFVEALIKFTSDIFINCHEITSMAVVIMNAFHVVPSLVNAYKTLVGANIFQHRIPSMFSKDYIHKWSTLTDDQGFQPGELLSFCIESRKCRDYITGTYKVY